MRRPRREEESSPPREPADRATETLTRLARIPEENPDPVFRISAGHVLLYHNPAGEELCRVWGCRLGQRVPASIQMIVSAALAERAVTQHEVVFASHTYWLTVAPSVADGYVNVYARDITDRKRAEEALRQAEQIFRAIFDNTSDGIFLLELEARKVTMGNRSCLQMLGYTEEEFTTLGLADLHPEADLPFIYAQIEEFLNGGKPIRHDIRFQRKDGSILFADVSPSLVQIDGTRYVLVALKDITERKQMEEEIRQHAEHLEELVAARTGELRESEARYRSLYHTIADGIFVIGEDGRIADANDSACAQLRYTREELLGMPVSAVSAGPDFNLGELLDRLRGAGSLSYETAHRRKDGVTIPVELSVALIEYRGRPAVLLVARNITERRRAEDAVAESRMRYRGLVEKINDWVWEIDADGVYTYVSPRARELLGYAPEEIVGKTPFDLMPPAEARRVWNAFEPIWIERKPLELLENTLVRKDGSLVTVETSGMPVFAEDGTFLGYTGVDRDVTSRKQAQEALGEKEYLLSESQRIGHIGSWSVDLTTEAVTWTPETYRLFGVAPEIFVPSADALLRLLHPDDRDAMREWIRAALAGAPPGALEVRVPLPDGSVRVLIGRGEMVYTDDHRPVRLVGTVQDVTERKQAQEALQFTQFAVDHTADAAFWMTEDARLFYVNEAACQALGYSREELLQKTVYDIDPAFTETMWRESWRKLKAEKSIILETVHRTRDGRVYPVEIRANYLEFGGRAYDCAFARDITERKRAEAALRQLSQKNAEALRVARMGHWEFDFASGMFTFNDQYYTLHGTTAREAGGYQMTAADFARRYVHPDDAHLVQEHIQQALAANDPDFQVQVEARILRADGEPRWVTVWFRIEKDAHGKTIRLYGVNQDITERRQAEEALRVSEEHYRSLFDNMLNGFAYCRMQFEHGRPVDLTYLEVNRAFETLTGLRNVIGKNVSEVIPGLRETNPELFEIYGRVALTGRPEQVETYVEPLGMWFLISVYSPQKEHFVAVFDVITERKRAEAALQESEDRYRILLEHGFDGILVHENNRIVQLNDRLAEMTGYHRSELLGSNGLDLFTPDSQERIRQYIGSGATGSFEIQLRHRDGRLLEVESYGASCQFQGRPARIVGLRDVTERKRGEAALRESEERFRTAFDEGTVPMALTALDSTLLKVNSAFCRMLGRSPAELVGRSFTEITHPDDRAANLVGTGRLACGAISSFRMEKRYLRKDGAIVWGDMSTAAVRDDQGRPLYCVTHIQDVTDRRQAEEALRRLNEQLELQVAQRTEELRHTVDRLRQLTLELSQAEDRERKRIAGILHEDVQQMLAAARFHLNLLNSEPRSAEESREIVEQVKHMLKDAIEKSRHLSHELSPALYQVDLTAVLEWLAHHMQQRYGLIVRVEPHGPVDSPSEPLKAFLYKVAQELLFNVVKHAGVSEARIRVRRRGQWIYLSVVDRGRGFDPPRLEGAAGFGLLSIRERVQLLGGRMKIRSGPGRGSRILIAVPDQGTSGAPLP